MAIIFDVIKEESYFISCWNGKVSDNEVLKYYRKFYESERWNNQLNELVDLTDADLSQIISQGLIMLAKLVEEYFINNHVVLSKTASYSKTDFPYGMARI